MIFITKISLLRAFYGFYAAFLRICNASTVFFFCFFNVRCQRLLEHTGKLKSCMIKSEPIAT